MIVRLVGNALTSLGPIIAQILEITGTPGISLGVLHHGEVIHTANYGLRDVENRLAPNDDTTYLLCSLTKAVTAAMVGMVVDDPKHELDFSTRLQDVLPEYHRDDAADNITIADLLSHRTGLPSYDGMWLSSDNQILVERSKAVPILNYAPSSSPAQRTADFLYSNLGYEVLGQVLEKFTNTSYLSLLRKKIIEPLKLNRTFYAGEPFDKNTAKSYTALDDASVVEVPPWGYGKDLLIGSGGAIRSSISDLLVLYKAFLDAGNDEVGMSSSDVTTSRNPFRRVPSLLQYRVGMPSKSFREYSYASGWMRVQLPNFVDLFADVEPPPLGLHGQPRLMIYHQGYIAGNVAYVALFPETSTIVVALANGSGLTDTLRLICQMLIETVFQNDFEACQYRVTAEKGAKDTIALVGDMYNEILDARTNDRPKHPYSSYVGRLQVAYMGAEHDTFDLNPYQTDSFYWFLDFNESARRARLPNFPKEYFILEFGCSTSASWGSATGNVEMECLTWKHEFSLAGDGETFRKNETNMRIGVQHLHDDI